VWCLSDKEGSASSNNGGAFAQDHLDETRVPIARDCECLGRRVDISKMHKCAFALRDHLVRGDNHVAGFEATDLSDDTNDCLRKIVARLEVRKPTEREERNRAFDHWRRSYADRLTAALHPWRAIFR
jgi:hypothetical protein